MCTPNYKGPTCAQPVDSRAAGIMALNGKLQPQADGTQVEGPGTGAAARPAAAAVQASQLSDVAIQPVLGEEFQASQPLTGRDVQASQLTDTASLKVKYADEPVESVENSLRIAQPDYEAAISRESIYYTQ